MNSIATSLRTSFDQAYQSAIRRYIPRPIFPGLYKLTSRNVELITVSPWCMYMYAIKVH
jgi:hypothetical protein